MKTTGKIIKFKNPGSTQRVSMPISDITIGKSWASNARELGESLMRYGNKTVRIAFPIDQDSEYATYDIEERDDTVYIMTCDDTPISIAGQVSCEVAFSERLREQMGVLMITKRELAEQIDISEEEIEAYLDGTIEPDLKTLVILSEVFSVSLDTLVKG